MKNLINKIANYKRATQTLLEKTKEYEAFVRDNIPSELWGKFDIGRCGNSSNFLYHILVDDKLIPRTPDKFGDSFYWGGDFNYRYEYVTPVELIEWCSNLPALIAKATEYIDKLISDAEAIAAKTEIPQS